MTDIPVGAMRYRADVWYIWATPQQAESWNAGDIGVGSALFSEDREQIIHELEGVIFELPTTTNGLPDTEYLTAGELTEEQSEYYEGFYMVAVE